MIQVKLSQNSLSKSATTRRARPLQGVYLKSPALLVVADFVWMGCPGKAIMLFMHKR